MTYRPITDELRAQIRAAARRNAAQAPDHFTVEQRDVIARNWVRTLRRQTSAEVG